MWTKEMINSNKNNDSWFWIFSSRTASLTLDHFIENPNEYCSCLNLSSISILDNTQQYIIPFVDDSLIEEVINETIYNSIKPSVK
jgi:hypothetical protein